MGNLKVVEYDEYKPVPPVVDTNRQVALIAAATHLDPAWDRRLTKRIATDLLAFAEELLPWLENHEP